ncbi:MAG: hypothetical protein AAGH65_06565, partial [Pseudomonadota bacterium]
MFRLWVYLIVLWLPSVAAQTSSSGLAFGDPELAYDGIPPSLGFNGTVYEEPLIFSSEVHFAGVTLVNTVEVDLAIETSLYRGQGLGYRPAPPYESPTIESIIDDNIRFIFDDDADGGSPAYEGCHGVEGTTGPFSSDLFVVKADIGAKVPAISAASQFRCDYIRRQAPAPSDEVVIFYLRAGPLRNEFTVRLVRYADDEVEFGDALQVDQGVGQVSGYGIDSYKTLPFRGPGVPSWIAVWDSFGSNGDDKSLQSIQARVLDEQAAPIGDQFQVNTFINNGQFGAKVSSNNQRFVVVWTSQGSPGSDDSGTSVQARLYEADGTPVGDQFQVNQAIMGDQFEPDAVMLDDGSFYVVWTDIPLVNNQILGRPFDADGAPLADAIVMSDSPGSDMPKIESNGRDVLVLWRVPNGIESRFAISRIFRDGFEGVGTGTPADWWYTLNPQAQREDASRSTVAN